MFNQLQPRPQSRTIRTQINLSKPLIRQADKQQAQNCFKLAKQHQKRNQIIQAKQLYIQTTIYDPNYYQAYCNLGACYRKQLKLEEAISAYLKAKSIKNQDSITNYNLANAYRVIGNQQKAVELYEFVIKLKQNQHIDIGDLYIDSYINLGVCYKNTGNYDKAIQAYEKVRKQFPNQFSILFNQAICYLRFLRNINKKRQTCLNLVEQTVNKTQQLFNQILIKQPQNQIAQIAVIELKYFKDPKQQTINKCIEEFNRIGLKLNISQFQKEQISKQKAYCLNLLKRHKQSAEEYKKSLQNQKLIQNDSIIKRITIAQNQKVNKYESQHQQRQNKLFEKEEDIVTGLNKNTWVKPEKPKEKSQRNVQINSQFHEVLNKLLQILNQDIAIQQCLQQVQRAQLDKKTKNEVLIILYSILSQKQVNDSYAQFAFHLYKDYFLKGHIDNQVSIELFSIETHRAIASVLTLLGFSQKAIEHYQIISESYKKQNLSEKDSLQQLYSGLATNYESQGLYSKAIQQFKNALGLDPQNYVLYFNLAYSQQLGGEEQNAIQSYTKFLQLIQLQMNIDEHTKNNFIIQGLINRFVCGQNINQNSIKTGEQVQQKINLFYGKDISYIIQCIDVNVLLSFWLKLADIYEIMIFNQIKGKGVGSDQMKLKLYKQKLFNIYLSLLQLPHCPDKQAILINCGNILYEQKQYVNALNFYNRVHENKQQVLNNISLIYFNLHEHEKAITFLQQAIQTDPSNKISLINYDIYRWVYCYYFGDDRQKNKEKNVIYSKYNCSCQKQFNSRLEYGKSLILKLTNRVSYNLQQYDQKDQNGPTHLENHERFLQELLEDREKQEDWLQPESKRKHQFLIRYLTAHCKKQKHDKLEQVPSNIIKELLNLSVQKITQKDKISQKLKLILSKLNDINCKDNYINIESVTSAILFIFIYLNGQQIEFANQIKNTIKQHINQNKKYHYLTLNDQYTSEFFIEPTEYPSKDFNIVYPSVQLKIKNIIQTFIVWEGEFETQLKYLFKIVQTIAYKRELAAPIMIDYHLPHCKYKNQEDQGTLIKTYKIAKNIWEIDYQHQFNTQVGMINVTQAKNTILSKIDLKFACVLEQKIAQISKDNILSVSLSEQVLPMKINLCFENFNCCMQYINQLCMEIDNKPIKIEKQNISEVNIILNKLLKIGCRWNQLDNLDQIVNQLNESPFGVRAHAAIKLDSSDLDFLWKSNEENKKILQPYLGLFSNIQKK